MTHASPASPPSSPASDKRTAAGGIDPKLLEFLVCPLTKQTLRYDRARQELISDTAQLAHPIRDGIPIMLIDQARSIDPHAAGPVPVGNT